MKQIEIPLTQKVKKVGRGNLDVTFLVLVLLILTFGLIMLFSASYAYAYYHENDSFYYIKRQLIFAAGGVIAMIVASHMDYRNWMNLAEPVLGVTLGLLVIVLFCPEINGVHRWIPLGFTTFQPSEIAKFAIVLMFAKMITLYGERLNQMRIMLRFLIVLGIVVILMVLEPHLSGTILIISIAGIMLFIGGLNGKWIAVAGGLAVSVVAAAIMIPGVVEYARGRLEYWLDPFADTQGLGYQTIQSLLAIGSGGVMGLGLGNSRQKYLYVPEPQNDFIFSIVCEELGLVGAAIVVILFALLVWRGYVIAIRAKDKFGSMLAVGLTTQVGLQALLNVAVVTNTIPNTGISLPFFSYGGTALMMLLAQMGVILSVSRRANMEKQ
ncbi:MAG: putative lipid II flippase FtsW [Oscillospiraceae bacterium]|nr:putative lipid II flippase FtsW [Oscillospiraceae bacterium]MBR2636395.1 putative lipid II flippase FtsW [Oscillospiraceae bacterium]